jgi:hypothetical protein
MPRLETPVQRKRHGLRCVCVAVLMMNPQRGQTRVLKASHHFRCCVHGRLDELLMFMDYLHTGSYYVSGLISYTKSPWPRYKDLRRVLLSYLIPTSYYLLRHDHCCLYTKKLIPSVLTQIFQFRRLSSQSASMKQALY